MPEAVATATHPVLWYREVATPTRLIAVDWDGRRTGVLDLSTAPNAVRPCGDGTRLLVEPPDVVIRAAQVWPVGLGDWAGDARHLCSFRGLDGSVQAPTWERVAPEDVRVPTAPGLTWYSSSSAPAALFLQEVESAAWQQVAPFGTLSTGDRPGILLCALPGDSAWVSLSRRPPVPLHTIRHVTLSTGAIAPLPVEPRTPGDDLVVFSNDGQFTAVGCSGHRGRWPGEAPPDFSVYEARTGAYRTTVAGWDAVGFSDDGRCVLVSRMGSASGWLEAAVLDWRDDRVLWRTANPLGSWRVRPHSADFLVSHRTWRIDSRNRQLPVEDLWIVRPGGETTLVARETLPLS